VAGTSKWKWVKPDVYPLIAALGVGISFLGYSVVHNFSTNPDIRYVTVLL
jgi:NADH-ubiquinone reductase complex 1 MLRQ subunit